MKRPGKPQKRSVHKMLDDAGFVRRMGLVVALLVAITLLGIVVIAARA